LRIFSKYFLQVDLGPLLPAGVNRYRKKTRRLETETDETAISHIQQSNVNMLT